MPHIESVFTDKQLITRIQSRLPAMFQLAELENARAGRIGMEVGSARERIIIALLIYKFGAENVETNLPVTQPEVDVKVFGEPLSIKTITGRYLSGVKLIWTVDAQRAQAFSQHYIPNCDILLTQVNWNGVGGFYLFPKAAQVEIFNQLGRERYIKLPRAGTNPRGVEISKEALTRLASHSQTHKIQIQWSRQTLEYNPYQRWIELWQKD